MKIDINKKYRTRDGREVIIHAIDGPETDGPIIASVKCLKGWDTRTHRPDGSWSLGVSDRDLIEVREPREWKATVIRANGALSGYRVTDEASEGFEVIRVREIID